MLRSELISASRRVRHAIRQPSMLALFRSRDEQISIEQILEAFRDWVKIQDTFGAAEHKMLDCVDLLELTQTSYWHQLLSVLMTRGTDPASAIGFGSLRIALREADRKLPKLVSLLQNDTDTSLEQVHNSGISRITLILPEMSDEFSTPHRIVEALESISYFYEVLSTISGPSRTDLSLLSCDAGSGKSFEFVGDFEIIEKIKIVILSIWGKVIYFSQRQYADRLDVAARSLPILDEISELTNKHKLELQQSEMLRNKITAAARKFLLSGAIIPEINENSHFDPTALLTASSGFLLRRPAEAAERERGEEAEPARDDRHGPNGTSQADADYTEAGVHPVSAEDRRALLDVVVGAVGIAR